MVEKRPCRITMRVTLELVAQDGDEALKIATAMLKDRLGPNTFMYFISWENL